MVNEENIALMSAVDFAREMEAYLEQHDYERPRVGDIRHAVIVASSPQGLIVDLGLKRDGIVQPSDLAQLEPEVRDALEVGEEISVYVTDVDKPDSLLVSYHMARLNRDWIRAQELLESGEIVEVTLTDHNRGGALIQFGGLQGFVPASHLDFLQPGLNDEEREARLVQAHSTSIRVKIIEVDRQRRRLVLSNREAERERQSERRRELLAELTEGDVVPGTVTGWRDFGAFVDLGGVDGLIHISELAWHRIDHPRDVVQLGEQLDVHVLKVDRERERISLSRKRLRPNPWRTAEDRYHVGQLVEGRVIRVVDYGAFVEVEPGIEGLLHASEVASVHVSDVREYLKEGENHLLRVVSIDGQRERMGLSLKAVTPTEQIEWMTGAEAPEEAAAPLTPVAAEAATTESTAGASAVA
ncbi:MAG: S1 RNA-binding domain-containing protein [Candidatus Promineifilaceae bacterium]|nr:S1 RNA-binding domain-containing protein [Candidatus Promineifilaceae bacterium]